MLSFQKGHTNTEINFDIQDDNYEVPMLLDVTEVGETPYFVHTTISAKNLLAYIIWHSWTCQLKKKKKNIQNMQ